MRHAIVSTAAIAAFWLTPSLGLAHADTAVPPKIAIAVVDFDYVDTSGEARDQTDEHRTRLGAFMLALRQDLAASGKYRVVPLTCHPAPCLVGRSTLPELRNAAQEAGAKVLLMGGIHKESTLVQWAKVLAVDAETDAVVFDNLFTFRGDTDDAWTRAETFIAQKIAASSAGSDPSSPPIKLALFDFEVEDLSAGASVTGENAADAAQLSLVTSEVRRLIEQSGRYRLIDVGGADAEAAKAHWLRKCDGCDAGIALKLGAEQSFVGIVTRISRTEYVVAFRIRDARTGAVISAEQTDLRMGADYSWNRGAAWLIKNRLLKSEDQP